MIPWDEIECTLEEIEALKKEWFETKTYHGTDKPIVLDDRTAEHVIVSRKRHESYINSVHESHDMCEWTSKIMAPVGTARFYAWRECNICGGEQYHHPAGRFIDRELEEKCMGV